MLPRVLEPEVMDSPEEARDYDAMDHAQVNRVFVDDLLRAPAEANLTLSHPIQLLDVGTGTAQIPIELCRQGTAYQVTAIDLAAHMLELGRQNVAAAGLERQIRLELVDAKRLPHADGQFDAVISNSIVHHIPEPRFVLAEMLRVLRPGGLLFVRDLLRPENLETLERLVTTYAGEANAHQQQMFRDSLHAALTLDEVRDLLRSVGASADWAAQTSDRHWTVCGIRRSYPG